MELGTLVASTTRIQTQQRTTMENDGNSSSNSSNSSDDDNHDGGWTKSQRLEVRTRARHVLRKLQEEVMELMPIIKNDAETEGGNEKGEEEYNVRYFQHTGFLRVAQFAEESQVAQMKHDMLRWVYQHWDPSQTTSEQSFATDDRANEERGDYFLDSADRVHFFVEPAALDPISGTLKPEYGNNHNMKGKEDDLQEDDVDIDDSEIMERMIQKAAALNKVGHGLHCQEGTSFHRYATSFKIQDLVYALGWTDPVIPQSMYIFKQPHIGGAVNSHQDATFLHTTPRQTCLGLWLALDDATLDNGCLWVRPQSHREPLRRQFIRNPDYFGPDTIEKRSNVLQGGGDATVPKLLMKSLLDDADTSIPWDGSLPDHWQPSEACCGLFQAGFVPVECQAGDLVVFYGTLDHLSLPNESKAPRHTFQLHLVEGPQAGVTWSKSNWLQYPNNNNNNEDCCSPFMSIAKPLQQVS